MSHAAFDAGFPVSCSDCDFASYFGLNYEVKLSFRPDSKMRIDGKSTRYHERTRLEIPVEIVYRENADDAWRENTLTDEITVCGGGFALSRPVEPKRLIHLSLPMPKKFRLFDFGKDRYEVWGVIRYVRIIPVKITDRISVKVGAALVGGKPPPSFLRDPTTRYDLKPVLRNESLWDLRELPRNAGRYARSAEVRRDVAVKVLLETIDESGRVGESVVGLTQNVSESGMAIVVKLPTENPKYVLIKTQNKTLSLLAKVRGIHSLEAEKARRLHIEFISGKWFV